MTHEDVLYTDQSRRNFLRCSAWAGAGVIWVLVGGVPKAFALDATGALPKEAMTAGSFQFVQISDTHIGFNKPANPEPPKTLEETIGKVNALTQKPSLILHTGDITHLSKAEEFDLAEQLLKKLSAQIYYTPGEHDNVDEGQGKLYLDRFGKGSKGNGWYSFDDHGVHFICLVNNANFQPGHMAQLGAEQLKWLADDLRAIAKSTPIVVFAHIPLWVVHAPWGWGTEDGDQAMALLRDYGSVTVLNGHIHQVIQKVEGNITFHTARSTAYPQPKPGDADAPGPMKVPEEQLRSYLGITEVKTLEGKHTLALTDSTLA